MSKKPKIGVPGWMSKEVFGVSLPYIEYISKFGCPVILTPDEDVREDLDLLFLPGGADIDTSRYGQAPGYSTGGTNQILEYFDKVKLPKYIDMELPIIGVCRGLQSLNALFGGTLKQDIDHYTSSFPTEGVHDLWVTKKYEHFISLIKGKVNSRHHQCIDVLGEGFEVVAGAREDKTNTSIPEVIVHTTRPIYAVQWHPEDCVADKLTPSFFNKFLKKQAIKEKSL